MKKRVVIGVAAIACLFFSMFCFTACGRNGSESSTQVSGTYYFYEDGSIVKDNWLKLEDGTWSDSDGSSGTYEYKDGQIVIYVDFFGSSEIFAKGTVKEGVLTLSLGAGMGNNVYCKEGVTPSENGNNPSGPQKGQVSVTYNANGGKFASGNTTYMQNVEKGVLLIAPDSPTRAGYTFAGWAKNKNGSEMWRFDEDKANGEITLYAHWNEMSAKILSVAGASIEDNKIFMLVDKSTDAKIYKLNKPIDDSFYNLFVPFGKVSKDLGRKLLHEVIVLDIATNVPILSIQPFSQSEFEYSVKIRTMNVADHENLRRMIAYQVRKYNACRRCLKCESVCPFGAITVSPLGYKIDETKCKHCKKCVTAKYLDGGCLMDRFLKSKEE